MRAEEPASIGLPEDLRCLAGDHRETKRPVEPAGLVELRGARSRPLGQCSLVGAILPEQHLCLGRSRPQAPAVAAAIGDLVEVRSEEHTSELQSLMRISYAVFCLTQKTKYTKNE